MKILTESQSMLVALYPYTNEVTEINKNEQSVLLYPIPASDKLMVNLPTSVQDNVSIMLFDTRGVSINIGITKSSSGFQIDTTNFPRGLYILKIKGTYSNSVHRVILK